MLCVLVLRASYQTRECEDIRTDKRMCMRAKCRVRVLTQKREESGWTTKEKEAKNCDGWLLLIPYIEYSLLDPATFSSSLTRSLKQGKLKGDGKNGFPNTQPMVVRGRLDKEP